MNKPLGLKIIAWFFIIEGVLVLGIMLFGSTFMQEVAKKENISMLQLFYTAISSALGIVFGIGLLCIKKWAWLGVVIIEVVGAIWSVISIVMSLNKELTPASIVGSVLGLAIIGIIIAYLMRKDIKKMFQISV